MKCGPTETEGRPEIRRTANDEDGAAEAQMTSGGGSSLIHCGGLRDRNRAVQRPIGVSAFSPETAGKEAEPSGFVGGCGLVRLRGTGVPLPWAPAPDQGEVAHRAPLRSASIGCR